MNDMVAAEQNLNPFANAPVAARPQNETAVAVQSAREVAEVQASMVMARRFPRDEVAVMDRILQACTRPTLAEGALYEYARGGTDIKGPSIRLAECLAQYWGHLDFGWRVMEERPGATKVQAFCWDMQSGTKSEMTFDVVHEMQARGSRKILHDPRDIYEHVANAASRRLRACILRVIPGDVVEAAVKQCEVTLRTKAEVTPERVKNVVDQFAEHGVTRAMLEKRMQRRLEAITPGMLVQLGKIFTSLRDNISQPGDWFDLSEPEGTPRAGPTEPAGATQPTAGGGRGTEAVKSHLRKRAGGSPGNPEPPQPPGPAEPPPPTPPQATPRAKAPEPSDAFKDVVSFAKAGAIEQAVAIAATLADEAEALLAQEHIDAARKRAAS